MSPEDYQQWRHFHERRKKWRYLMLVTALLGIVGLIVRITMGAETVGYVSMDFIVAGPLAVFLVACIFDSFDRRHRKPRCLAVGVDPKLYMFPNVPYLFVDSEELPALNRIWYVGLPEDVTPHGARSVKCRVHRNALETIRGKFWNMKTTVPTPNQGDPPFCVKVDSLGDRPDMVEAVLWDPSSVPASAPPSQVLSSHPAQALLSSPAEALSSRAIMEARIDLALRLLQQQQQECFWNDQLFQLELQTPSSHFDMPPSYEEAIQLSAPPVSILRKRRNTNSL
ncbi:unnamed protein product [Darwinula stevensoni]|uniref:Uncharacterized protein n=1 Tax=Darwinula stevensoni TaxID=69355 RepID=A0A7R9ACE6_9CRUS|nr:unnamed protein product [Darwinula stevensoni]CAG0900283.1 unnamed protein product [Darwinula stevensoni]